MQLRASTNKIPNMIWSTLELWSHATTWIFSSTDSDFLMSFNMVRVGRGGRLGAEQNIQSATFLEQVRFFFLGCPKAFRELFVLLKPVCVSHTLNCQPLFRITLIVEFEGLSLNLWKNNETYWIQCAKFMCVKCLIRWWIKKWACKKHVYKTHYTEYYSGL